MLRRFGILGILLLSLSGFLPTALACAAMAQQADCCPPGAPPCDGEEMPNLDLPTAACCDVESAPTRAVAAGRADEKLAFNHDLPDAASSTVGLAALERRRQRRMPAPEPRNSPAHQQLLYLHTGRLRL